MRNIKIESQGKRMIVGYCEGAKRVRTVVRALGKKNEG